MDRAADSGEPRASPEAIGADVDPQYDAILIVSFGGPEGPDDVIPFLENVLRGKNVPRERLLEVAEHYLHFDGVSPINAHIRELIAALRVELDAHGITLPIYWGNRNWHPLLTDTLREMQAAGVQRAVTFVTSAYSSYSSCRQYQEDMQGAQAALGPTAPRLDKIRVFYNHPRYLEATVDRLREAVAQLPVERQQTVPLAFTAHSIPQGMADQCAYERQLREACRLVAEEVGFSPDRWGLVFQSRSGRPSDPWLEPDINVHLKNLAERGVRDVVVMPIGFLSDHMEVLYDLDFEARATCDALGLNLVRAATVGTHPLFIQMIRELIAEHLTPGTERLAVGACGPLPDACPLDCCPAPLRPTRPTPAS
jgi:ferrochelatase